MFATRRKGSLVGLDITTSSVKLIELVASGRGYRVEAYAAEPTPPFMARPRPMNLPTVAPAPIPVSPAGTHARPGLGRLVAVELRKMFDTRSGFWLMASIGALSVIATAAFVPARMSVSATPALSGRPPSSPIPLMPRWLACASKSSSITASMSGISACTGIRYSARSPSGSA